MNKKLTPMRAAGPQNTRQGVRRADLFSSINHSGSYLINDNTLDLHKAKAWIDLYPEYLRSILKTIVNNLMYIDEQEFFLYVKKSVDSLKQSVGDRPIYCFDYCGKYGKQKSNYWMSNICIQKRLPDCKYFDFAPSDTRKSFYEIESLKDEYVTIVDRLQKEKVKDIVVFDDASYSGQQISHEVFGILQILKSHGLTGFTIHVVCPFMTNQAKDWINSFVSRYDYVDGSFSIAYHDSYTIPVLGDLLDDLSIASLTELGNDPGWREPQTKAYLYFWHKLPDKLAFPEAVSEGRIPYLKYKMPFIEAPIPPYKK